MDYLIVIFKAVVIVLTFVALLFLVYITTKFVGGKAKMTMKSKNMRIVESISLGLDKRILLLKVGSQYILVASSGKNVEFLTTVNLDDDINLDEETENDNKFGGYLQKYLENLKSVSKLKSKTINDNPQDMAYKDGSLFKANLMRLKNITTKIDTKVKNNECINEEKKDI